MRISPAIKAPLLIVIMALGTTFGVWLPFLLHLTSIWTISLPAGGFETVKKNYDGLNYVIVAKSWYDPQVIAGFGQNLPYQYFAAHLPGYPLAIRLFAFLVNYPNAMLLATVLFTVTAGLAFYWLLSVLDIKQNRLWLCFLFFILPPRWFVVHSVGAAEPMFETMILLSIGFFLRAFRNDRYINFFLAGFFGALATITKSPGILLFFGYGLFLVWQLIKDQQWTVKRAWADVVYPSLSILLIPAALIGVFLLYATTFHDFFAYFHSGDNIHLSLPPFGVFNRSQPWVGSIWLEDILFYFFIYTIAVIKLWQQKFTSIAVFCGIFLLATMCVAHRDIARYSLPIAPFAILAFRDTLAKREVKIAIVVLLIPLFLYSYNFIAGNTFPVASLAPYL